MMRTSKLIKRWPSKAKLVKLEESMNDTMYSYFIVAIRNFEIIASGRVILMI